MVKMIFSDFDYTLMDYYSDKNYFDDYQIEIIKKIKEKGIKFSIVSGRCVSFFNQFPNLLEVVDYILGSNGSCIYDVQNKEYIHTNLIDKDEFNKLISYSIENNYEFILNCVDKRYKYGKFDDLNMLNYEEGKDYDCEQVILFLNKIYNDDFVKHFEYYNTICINNGGFWGDICTFDINDNGVSKGNAIRWLCNELDIDKEDTIGFGDGINDVSMFEEVGKSIVVNNASDNVKNQADDVTLSYSDYGVFKYIENNFLK